MLHEGGLLYSKKGYGTAVGCFEVYRKEVFANVKYAAFCCHRFQYRPLPCANFSLHHKAIMITRSGTGLVGACNYTFLKPTMFAQKLVI